MISNQLYTQIRLEAILYLIAIPLGAYPVNVLAQQENSYANVFVSDTVSYGEPQPYIEGTGADVSSERKVDTVENSLSKAMNNAEAIPNKTSEETPQDDHNIRLGSGGAYIEVTLVKKKEIQGAFPIKVGVGTVGLNENKDRKAHMMFILKRELLLDNSLSRVMLSVCERVIASPIKSIWNTCAKYRHHYAR